MKEKMKEHVNVKKLNKILNKSKFKQFTSKVYKKIKEKIYELRLKKTSFKL